jgi:nicotinamide riboside transporter PnuC
MGIKQFGKAALFGLLDWLLPFAASFVVFPLHESNYNLFESIMTVVIVLAAVLFATVYRNKYGLAGVRNGMAIGLLWLVINLCLDMLLFLPEGKMHLSPELYFSQIGVKYLSIPIILIGIASSNKKA